MTEKKDGKRVARKRTECVMLRYTPAEYALLRQSATEAGYQEMAPYIRDASLARARGVTVFLPQTASKQERQLSAALGPWKAMGHNPLLGETVEGREAVRFADAPG